MKITKCVVEKEPEYTEDGGELLGMDTTDEFIEDIDIETFQELLDLMRDCSNKSDSGEPSEWTWVYGQDENYVSGGYTETSLHFKGIPRQLKYWKLAIRANNCV